MVPFTALSQQNLVSDRTDILSAAWLSPKQWAYWVY